MLILAFVFELTEIVEEMLFTAKLTTENIFGKFDFGLKVPATIPRSVSYTQFFYDRKMKKERAVD